MLIDLFVSGMCGVRLTQARGTPGDAPDSFGLTTAAGAVAAAAATGTTGCTIQFLRVPDAVVKTAAGVVENGRVCGGLLSNVAGQVVSGAIDSKYIFTWVDQKISRTLYLGRNCIKYL